MAYSLFYYPVNHHTSRMSFLCPSRYSQISDPAAASGRARQLEMAVMKKYYYNDSSMIQQTLLPAAAPQPRPQLTKES